MELARFRSRLCVSLLVGLWLPSAVVAQDWAARFRSMDRNGDGVVSREEWRGNDQSFGRLDRNGDGVVSRDEIRDTVGTTGTIPDLSFADDDGNGEVTAQEWMRFFNQMDADRDGVLSQTELGFDAPATQTVAFKSGRERGLSDGRLAGREDRDRGLWDLDGQRELERADAGYRPEMGPLDQYQAGYREGFRQGYAQGYGVRRQ